MLLCFWLTEIPRLILYIQLALTINLQDFHRRLGFCHIRQNDVNSTGFRKKEGTTA